MILLFSLPGGNWESSVRCAHDLSHIAVELCPLGHCPGMGRTSHFSVSFGLVSPGVMVVYTPRDQHEVAVCRSLFWVSYNFSMTREENEIR